MSGTSEQSDPLTRGAEHEILPHLLSFDEAVRVHVHLHVQTAEPRDRPLDRVREPRVQRADWGLQAERILPRALRCTKARGRAAVGAVAVAQRGAVVKDNMRSSTLPTQPRSMS